MVRPMPSVVLKPGHVQPVWAGHPWVYAQAVARVEGGATAGDDVAVIDPRGNFLGRGFYSPSSAIVVRIATRNPKTRLDAAWLRLRMSKAHELRHEIGLPTARTNGFRLVHAEGDQIPGLVVDRFDDVAAVQLTTVGMQQRRAMVIDSVQAVFGVRAIVDRTPRTHAKAEGFEPEPGVVRGPSNLDAYRFKERGFAYEIPLEIGQKTGFYFDQRPLRARVEQLSRGRRVLDAFCFVGSFGLAAARGGASSVLCIDENVLALDTGARCAAANGLADRVAFTRGRVSSFLQATPKGDKFDLVVLDPPATAPNQKAVHRARKHLTWLVRQTCPLLRPGGLLVLSSCSAAVDLETLSRVLAVGAREAGMYAVVVERWFQGGDHPAGAAFPEGLYLKSLIARIETV